MIDEEIKSGKINSKIYHTLIKSSGGYFHAIIVLIFAIIWQITKIYGNIYLTNWSDKVEPYYEDDGSVKIHVKEENEDGDAVEYFE